MLWRSRDMANKAAKETLPCREYFQELKDNILTMFPEKTKAQIAVYESWFNEGIRAAQEWRPIDTAPKDGTSILLYYPHRDIIIRGAYVPQNEGDWELGIQDWED